MPTRVTRSGVCRLSKFSWSQAICSFPDESRAISTGRNNDATTTPSVGARAPAPGASSPKNLASASRCSSSYFELLGDGFSGVAGIFLGCGFASRRSRAARYVVGWRRGEPKGASTVSDPRFSARGSANCTPRRGDASASSTDARATAAADVSAFRNAAASAAVQGRSPAHSSLSERMVVAPASTNATRRSCPCSKLSHRSKAPAEKTA